MAKRSRSYADYRRASPLENVRMGYTPLARRYVKASISKTTSRTSSISARQAETIRVREQFGLASPEIATKARAHEAIVYKTAQAEQAAKKNILVSFNKRARKQIIADAASGKRIKQRSADGSFSQRKRAAHGYRLSPDAADRYFDLRARKLAYEWIDEGDWHWMLDIAWQYNDPLINALRAYPPSYNVREAS
jgi:hypothetical protein